MKKILVLGIISAATVSGLVIGGVSFKQSGATTDPPIVTTVQQQGDELANHEARIANTENDVKDLQNNTKTSPSTIKVNVPVYSPPSNTPSVTVISATPVPNGENIDCNLVYSDNSSYTFTWDTVTKTVTSTVNAYNGQCDQTIIGKLKTSDVLGYN